MGGPLFAGLAETGGDVARVALPVPAGDLFDYAVPPALAAAARPGCRVRVRFRGRPLTGVVVERATASAVPRLHPLEAVLDAEPAVAPALLAIVREAANDALCPLGIALQTALPAGSTPRLARGVELTPRGRGALSAGALPAPLRPLAESLAAGPRASGWLQRRFADVDAQLDALERDGVVRRRPIEVEPAARARTRRVAALAAGLDRDAALAELARAPQQAALLRALGEQCETPVAALRERFPRAGPLLRALAERGFVALAERASPRDVLGPALEDAPPVELTPEQQGALDPIREAVRGRRFETFLLQGVTGSGKTEVYLRAVAEALRAGRRALVLVPEITLTHQILARLRARFGDGLAVLHSGLRPGERLEQWERLRTGTTPIAVGARSALFAPIGNLGLIVLDEEQDGAYKNDEGFRYHARDLAMRRARADGCPVVLGSATPSLETRFAADRGSVRRLVLTHRIGHTPLPSVEIVDLAAERDAAPRGRKIILSRSLERALADTLAEGGQAILLLNRRGFSTQILCFRCGHAWRCRDCDIALVYHAGEERLRCHYCDFHVPPPDACPECGAADAALLGVGTQRVVEEVRLRFPDARIERLDRDTASQRGHTLRVLQALRSGRLDVLVGTQIVAKGHDFPGVRLVGVVVADTGLHMPDFRAAERTFQLLTQVAGRAGRDRTPGRVVVQTFAPEHPAIRPVREHDYEAFYAAELAQRERLRYPPFGRLLHVVVSGEDAGRALEAAKRLAAVVPRGTGLEVLGPAPAPLARLRGRHRFALLVKGAAGGPLHEAGSALTREAARLPEGIAASVDANPVNML